MKTKTKKNENDNNAGNSSLKAALRRLVDCVPETRTQRLNFPTILLKCALVQFWISAIEFWQAREAGYPLLSKITIDLISAPASQVYAEYLFSVMWRPDGVQAEQNCNRPWTSHISQNEL